MIGASRIWATTTLYDDDDQKLPRNCRFYAEQHVSLRAYFLVFLALSALTVLTVAVSFLKLEPWHLAIALVIAVAKATLVALYFMHLIQSSRLVALVFATSLLWLCLLFALTFSDYLTRAWT